MNFNPTMEHTQRAIALAIKGGYIPKQYLKASQAVQNDWKKKGLVMKEQALLESLFWQSLGKSLGWGNSFGFIVTGDTGEIESWLESDSAGTVYQWEYQWYEFIHHLAEGKDADSFFAGLLN